MKGSSELEKEDSHVVEEDKTKTRSHGRLLFSFIPSQSTTLFSFSSLSRSESLDGLDELDTHNLFVFCSKK